MRIKIKLMILFPPGFLIFGFVLLASSAKVANTNVIYFRSGFEQGSVAEWVHDNAGNHTGGGYVTSELSRTGKYSWKAYNDPELPGILRISAKLLRWRFDYKEAYYSAWFYWPEDYRVSGIANQYVNFFQWKERAKPYDPTWIVVVWGGLKADHIAVHEYHRKHIHNKQIPLPKGRWFHVEAFLRKGRTDGKLIVWLDGREIYRFSRINTLGSRTNPSFLMWGVGNYGEPGVGKHIYVDDVVVSSYRIWTESGSEKEISE